MAIYAIGDLQGCYEPLLRLLERLRFDATQDHLLFTGDLVNRGPDSLACLRFVRALGEQAVTVLGNHDLHLLAAARSGKFAAQDTLSPIMDAPDRDELLSWLLQRPLAYLEPETGALLIHAGLPPQWTPADALRLAQEASGFIQGAQGNEFFAQMYGNQPDLWQESLTGHARIRCIINSLTRLRFVHADGRMEVKAKGAPGTQAAGLLPWFQHPQRRSADRVIVSGHWSTLGRVHWPQEKIWGLDTGCVWGGCLTALNLETGELASAGCEQYRKPGAV